MSDKIVTLDDLASIAREIRSDGGIIVHAHGCFDMLHVGHTQHFKAARKLGNLLVVTVTADPFVNKGQGRPRFNHHLRADMVAEIVSVDYVAVNFHATAAEAISLIRPHIFVKGIEFKGIEAEKDALREYGGRMEYVSGDVVFSSTELLAGK